MSDIFITENFLLETKTAERLYFDCAAELPIIDYHSHLPPEDIARDRTFKNITEIWLGGDHYKWRAMRANGVDESFCSGRASDREKFMKWAATVPATVRNPLYHWTHMELKNPFGITKLLNPRTADEIYTEMNGQLEKRWSVRKLLSHFKVETICTSDEPLDSLEYHAALAREGFPIKVLPSFRPDIALLADRPDVFAPFVKALAELTGIAIGGYEDFIAALKNRHDHFAARGCRLSDHGWERVEAADYTAAELKSIFAKLLRRAPLDRTEIGKYKSAVQYELATMDHEKGWVQMFHVGSIRNVNSKMFAALGRNTGFDSIGDAELARDLAKLLDRLESGSRLAKTILFNLNPKDNAVFATMIGNFQDGRTPGKMQWGPAWWFLDCKDGMEEHLNVLSNQGLLSRFVGMVTDSRSFLSFSRHEYFRRILCNLLGKEAESGLIPRDLELLGQAVKDICYRNAKAYFNF